MKTILIVDDDQHILSFLSRYLERRAPGLRVLTASGGREAIERLGTESVDLVVSDLRMPDGDGVDLLAHISSNHPGVSVIVMSGYVMSKDIDRLLQHGRLRCLRKPAGPRELHAILTEALQEAETTSLSSFSLAGILQLIEIDEKTCRVDVRGDRDNEGSLLFVRGRLQRAECGALREDDATLELLSWERPTIAVRGLPHVEDAQFGPDRQVSEMIERALGAVSPAPLPPAPHADAEGRQEGAAVPVPSAAAGEPAPAAESEAVPRSTLPPPIEMQARLKEVKVTLVAALMLTIYHLSTNLSGALRGFLDPISDHSSYIWLNHALFFWILALLWVVYRRWLATSKREAEFVTLLSSTGPELVMVLDEDQQIVMCNEAMTRVLGYEPAAVLHRPLDMLIRYEQPEAEQKLQFALEAVGFHRGEGTGLHRSGRRVPVEIITSLLRDRPGQLVLVRDCTERLVYERQLEAAWSAAEAAEVERAGALAKLESSYAKLKEAESLRDSLTHMVIHDMKTPLTVIESYVYLLNMQDGMDGGPTRGECLDGIVAQSRRLNLMVVSLLDADRIESGRMSLSPGLGPVGGSIEAALSYVSTPDVVSNIHLEGELDATAWYDPDVILRVLSNLLVNAIKYDDEGSGIIIRVEASGTEVVVSVLDRGPGVPADCREQVFEKFMGVEGDTHRRPNSTGLGLAFCRLAVEAHGGRIGVDPREGGGSRFWFTLPRACPAPTAPLLSAAPHA